MDLSTLNGRSESTVRIDGRDYQFSELPIASLADLQDWIRARTPHPIDAIKPHLDGLTADERMTLLREARDDARRWPPIVGTPDGAAALMSSQDGQIETIYVGLRVHQPETTRDEARRLYRAMLRDRDDQAVARIVAVMFGYPFVDDPPEGGPKKDDAPTSRSTGT